MGLKLLFYSSNTNNKDIHQPSVKWTPISRFFGHIGMSFTSSLCDLQAWSKRRVWLVIRSLAIGLSRSSCGVMVDGLVGLGTWSVGSNLGTLELLGMGQTYNMADEFLSTSPVSLMQFKCTRLLTYTHIAHVALVWEFHCATCAVAKSPLEIVSSAAMFSGGCGETRNICQSLGRIGKA